MKFLIVIGIVALAGVILALTPEQIAKGEEFGKACLVETGAAGAEVQKMKTGEFTSKDEKVHCFANCVLEKAGFMKDGVLQENFVIDRLSTNVDKDQITKIVGECKHSTGANKCEIAYNTLKCYAEHKAALA